MKAEVIHKNLKDKILIGLLAAACIGRVGTNYYFGLVAGSDNPEVISYYDTAYSIEQPSIVRIAESVYYRGQAIAEFLLLVFVTIMVKRNYSKTWYFIIDFFLSLSIFSLVKEYILNPLEWQPGEKAGFLIAAGYTVVKATSKFWLAAVKKFIKHIKIIFK